MFQRNGAHRLASRPLASDPTAAYERFQNVCDSPFMTSAFIERAQRSRNQRMSRKCWIIWNEIVDCDVGRENVRFIATDLRDRWEASISHERNMKLDLRRRCWSLYRIASTRWAAIQ